MHQPTSRPSRWRAAGALIMGGALAFGATFLPFGQLAWPAFAGESATTIVNIPGRDLATATGVQVQHFGALAPSTCFLIGGLWGAPLILAAIGVALALSRRWMPTARAWVPALLLILFGAGITALYCLAFLFLPHGEVIQPGVMLSYGPVVAVLGYTIALPGVIWAARLRLVSRRSDAGMILGQGGI